MNTNRGFKSDQSLKDNANIHKRAFNSNMSVKKSIKNYFPYAYHLLLKPGGRD